MRLSWAAAQLRPATRALGSAVTCTQCRRAVSELWAWVRIDLRSYMRGPSYVVGAVSVLCRSRSLLGEDVPVANGKKSSSDLELLCKAVSWGLGSPRAACGHQGPTLFWGRGCTVSGSRGVSVHVGERISQVLRKCHRTSPSHNLGKAEVKPHQVQGTCVSLKQRTKVEEPQRYRPTVPG